MSTPLSPRIGIYGVDQIDPQEKRGCALWPAGYMAAVTEAGGTPFQLERRHPGTTWKEALDGVHGILFLGYGEGTAAQTVSEERLCRYCREHGIPWLGVDQGMHVLNTTFGGTLHLDLPRDLPQALQHQHLPEKGDRHAINVHPGTRMCKFYGEGEIVVNSEHRRAVNRVAAGFRVGANALDGVIEAIETEGEGWFAVGVQWQPGAASASGLDIQLFRGFADACRLHAQGGVRGSQLVAA